MQRPAGRAGYLASLREKTFAHASRFNRRSRRSSNSAVDTARRPTVPLITEAGLHVHGTPIVQFRWEDIETLALEFLKGCYFKNVGSPLPQDARCWARNFDRDPRDLTFEWQRAIGSILVTRDGFPFSFSLAIGKQAVAGAFFMLWDFHVLFAASNLPEGQVDGES